MQHISLILYLMLQAACCVITMIEIRIHGRGGQGGVTAAELIATSAFIGGKYAQAFPNFGVERRGAPVEAYVRIDDKPIRTRAQVYHPNYIIALDATLLGVIDVLVGCDSNTTVIVNSEKNSEELFEQYQKFKCDCAALKIKVKTVPATQIALKILKKPIINTIMLGAFANISGLIEPASLNNAIKERFEKEKEIAKKNILAMNTAYCLGDGKDEYCKEVKKMPVGTGEKFAVST